MAAVHECAKLSSTRKPLARKVCLSILRMRFGSSCAKHLKWPVRSSSGSMSTTGTTICGSKKCIPRVNLLRGEKIRESTLPHDREAVCHAALPYPLTDAATVLLDAGLRSRESIHLDWMQVRIESPNGARFGFLTVLSGNAKNKKSRNIPLSARVVEVLKRWEPKREGIVSHKCERQAA